MKQTPQIRDSFTEIENKVVFDIAQGVSKIKQQLKEEKNHQGSDEEMYVDSRNHFDSMNESFSKRDREFEDPRKKLTGLKRQNRERQQQKPRRKIVHVEEETP